MVAIQNPLANTPKILDIELWLVPRTQNLRIKDENRCSNGQGWNHWDLDPAKNSTLTGPVGSAYEGLKIVLGLAGNPSRFGAQGKYGVHYGFGASQKNMFYGMSAWVRYATVEYPTTGPGAGFFANRARFNEISQFNHGDLNLNLECACGCPCPSGNCTPPSVCGNGIVEAGEQCDPGDQAEDQTCCKSDCTFENSGVICRPAFSGDECDVEETCTGTLAACPADGVEPIQTPCGARVGYCDVKHNSVCNGVDKQCPEGPYFFDTNNGPAWAR
jgi:hypothetical protein